MLDPLLQAVSLSASRLATTDMAVYLLNCLYLMQTTLSLYEFMEERLERLQVCYTIFSCMGTVYKCGSTYEKCV